MAPRLARHSRRLCTPRVLRHSTIAVVLDRQGCGTRSWLLAVCSPTRAGVWVRPPMPNRDETSPLLGNHQVLTCLRLLAVWDTPASGCFMVPRRLMAMSAVLAALSASILNPATPQVISSQLNLGYIRCQVEERAANLTVTACCTAQSHGPVGARPSPCWDVTWRGTYVSCVTMHAQQLKDGVNACREGLILIVHPLRPQPRRWGYAGDRCGMMNTAVAVRLKRSCGADP